MEMGEEGALPGGGATGGKGRENLGLVTFIFRVPSCRHLAIKCATSPPHDQRRHLERSGPLPGPIWSDPTSSTWPSSRTTRSPLNSAARLARGTHPLTANSKQATRRKTPQRHLNSTGQHVATCRGRLGRNILLDSGRPTPAMRARPCDWSPGLRKYHNHCPALARVKRQVTRSHPRHHRPATEGSKPRSARPKPHRSPPTPSLTHPSNAKAARDGPPGSAPLRSQLAAACIPPVCANIVHPDGAGPTTACPKKGAGTKTLPSQRPMQETASCNSEAWWRQLGTAEKVNSEPPPTNI